MRRKRRPYRTLRFRDPALYKIQILATIPSRLSTGETTMPIPRSLLGLTAILVLVSVSPPPLPGSSQNKEIIVNISYGDQLAYAPDDQTLVSPETFDSLFAEYASRRTGDWRHHWTVSFSRPGGIWISYGTGERYWCAEYLMGPAVRVLAAMRNLRGKAVRQSLCAGIQGYSGPCLYEEQRRRCRPLDDANSRRPNCYTGTRNNPTARDQAIRTEQTCRRQTSPNPFSGVGTRFKSGLPGEVPSNL